MQRRQHPPGLELPPGQQLVAPGKWPLVGERKPSSSTAPWEIQLGGQVRHEMSLSLAELTELPTRDMAVDIHCVTRWSKPGVVFRGVLLEEIARRVEPLDDARFVSFTARSERSHSTSLPFDRAIALGAMLAWQADARALTEEHGGPVRMVVPKLYFYKSVKWLTRIEWLASDRLGYWEAAAGYHNGADPWKQERFLASDLDPRRVRDLLRSRDFSGQELRGVDAREHDLEGLNAARAILRNADFRGCRLAEACFDGANLSGAHLDGADLRKASFVHADLEGTSFDGADLRGACLRGATLFGASFVPTDHDHSGPATGAVIDASTQIDESAMNDLTPLQQAYVAQRLSEARKPNAD